MHGEDEIKTLKLEAEKIQKNIADFVTSQQYHKANTAKEKLLEIEDKIREKRKKITIPRDKSIKSREYLSRLSLMRIFRS